MGQRRSMLYRTEYIYQALKHIKPLCNASAVLWKVAASVTPLEALTFARRVGACIPRLSIDVMFRPIFTQITRFKFQCRE